MIYATGLAFSVLCALFALCNAFGFLGGEHHNVDCGIRELLLNTVPSKSSPRHTHCSPVADLLMQGCSMRSHLLGNSELRQLQRRDP